MISIVCVYNNKTTLADFLQKSLQAQTVKYELITLDNSTGAFHSAAQALNHGALQIQSESTYILFAHQDIDLCSSAFLEETETMLDGLPNLGIAGVAGMTAEEKRVISNIMHGIPPVAAGRKTDKPTRVMTVDECCVIIPRRVFEQHQLDQDVCTGWDLYMAEYCLRMQQAGLDVYVLPSAIYHASRGEQIDVSAYFKTLKKVVRRYRRSYTKIHTTCGRWHTGIPVLLQRGWFYLRCLLFAVINKLVEQGPVPEWLRKTIQPHLKDYGQNVH
ncbi:MAG: glycosyltransferase family 2 protein [Deltaproteobacteria bacterium]|nr:glycosyltransferase family 2 protein [Deltaproteobacteria bacterium]